MPSANRIAKEQFVGQLNEKLTPMHAAVLSHYSGVTVEKITDLRKRLREQGDSVKVIKNTLALRAVEGTPLEALKDHFTGPTALAFTENDPVALAKALTTFAKEEEKFSILAGVLQGSILEKKDVVALANVPSREVLLARLAGALQSPYAGFVMALSGILRKLVYALEAIRRQKEEQG